MQLAWQQRLPHPILIFAAAKKNGPPAAGLATTTSASDTNFLCEKREWFRLLRPSRQRPSASDSILRCCEEEWPASRTGLLLHRFLISGPDLGIDARISPFTPSCVHRFLISWGKFGNHCRYLPGNVLQRAVILDFRPRFANHCSTIVVAVENGSACSGRRATTFRIRF